MRLEKRLGGFGLVFVQRDEMMPASALERLLAVACVTKEVLQRSEKE